MRVLILVLVLLVLVLVTGAKQSQHLLRPTKVGFGPQVRSGVRQKLPKWYG